ncbi:hypothetical protein GLOTRDRAFT_97219 [Gloeophyllum trabeum ATCC 11539]|uniref:Protein kinase domain-containing protein n=1 Tax=Gloeophyllum trabeum (strain ATCC 11539 / FP-39264 / Madison 617) TaxID=670483 RepID=S7PRW0_GLOTA|nr:uncharacterized protein GLOTRDRAFT_97219 [Gloeophyllum trabeum ATCC 11539]EPQ50118.1 hypothetical protein GLOTRDRAFT_97219 [Gloeophyllum trabeum ATCC 11539]
MSRSGLSLICGVVVAATRLAYQYKIGSTDPCGNVHPFPLCKLVTQLFDLWIAIEPSCVKHPFICFGAVISCQRRLWGFVVDDFDVDIDGVFQVQVINLHTRDTDGTSISVCQISRWSDLKKPPRILERTTPQHDNIFHCYGLVSYYVPLTRMAVFPYLKTFSSYGKTILSKITWGQISLTADRRIALLEFHRMGPDMWVRDLDLDWSEYYSNAKYGAPECLPGVHRSYPTTSSDTYSFGMIAYEVATHLFSLKVPQSVQTAKRTYERWCWLGLDPIGSRSTHHLTWVTNSGNYSAPAGNASPPRGPPRLKFSVAWTGWWKCAGGGGGVRRGRQDRR